MHKEHKLLIGPPGTGKTAFASETRAFFGKPADTARARSYAYRVAGLDHPGDLTPPFRAPHHTVSVEGIIGRVTDGYLWRPGEVSLAHGGTLYLDELPEFRPPVLRALEQVLSRGYVDFREFRVPARFRVVAAMNPCPCGYLQVPGLRSARKCRCTIEQIEKYQRRLPRWIWQFAEVLYPDRYAPAPARRAVC